MSDTQDISDGLRKTGRTSDLATEPDTTSASPHPHTRSELLFTHRDFHFASVIHAVHRSRIGIGNVQDLPQIGSDGELLAQDGPPVALPVIPKSPPVCSQPPPMRFCKNVAYPVYRPSAEHTFAQLDFDSHAVFKKIAPHMRISERHFDLAEISACRANFRQFLCLRNFPRCCHVGLCSEYGAPEPPLTAASLSAGGPLAPVPAPASPPPPPPLADDLERKATKVSRGPPRAPPLPGSIRSRGVWGNGGAMQLAVAALAAEGPHSRKRYTIFLVHQLY